jgi:hypothetical protein
MTAAGILVLDALGVALLLWLLDLVRRGRLYVGYGVIFVLGVSGACLVLSVSPLRSAADRALSQLFPSAGPLVVGLAAVMLLLIYILTQVTIISNRLADVVQELAIREAPREPGSKKKTATADRPR